METFADKLIFVNSSYLCRWDLDSPRWKASADLQPRYGRGSAAEKRETRQSVMDAAKAAQLAALKSVQKRLMAFERDLIPTEVCPNASS